MKTMNKIDYLYLCIKEAYPLRVFDWYYKALAIPEMIKEDYSELNTLSLVKQPDGMYFLDENRELVKLIGWEKGKPLFHPQTLIPIDNKILSTVQKPMEVKIGSALLNAVIIPKDLRDKFVYLEGKLSPRDFEKQVALRVINKDEPKKKDSIYREDKDRIDSGINFFNGIADLTNIPVTEKSITRAPGVEEFVNKLIEEAGDNITDRVVLTEIENKVREYDSKFLDGDPVAENLFSGKAFTARHKLFGMYGEGLDFINDSSNNTVITQSVADGIDPTPETLVKYNNDLRYASFSRGDNTALAGVIFKYLQQALGSIRMMPNPCNTTRGLVKIMNEREVSYSVGRFIKKGNSWKVIADHDEAKALLNKEVEMRSPRTCKTPGNDICYACMSARFFSFSNAVSGLAAKVSEVLLTMFLKLMHGTKTEIIEIDIDDLIN